LNKLKEASSLFSPWSLCFCCPHCHCTILQLLHGLLLPNPHCYSIFSTVCSLYFIYIVVNSPYIYVLLVINHTHNNELQTSKLYQEQFPSPSTPDIKQWQLLGYPPPSPESKHKHMLTI